MTYSGTWNLTMNTPMGDRQVAVDLTQDGDSLTGTASADGNSNDIENGRIEDGQAKFDVNVTSPMPLTLSFEFSADGDDASGNVKLGMFGNSPLTGSRG